MKNIKLTIVLGLLLSGLLISCKKQDGYSDEVRTNQNPENSTAKTVNDSAGSKNSEVNGSAGTNGQAAGAQSTGSQSVNSSGRNSGTAGAAINTTGSAKTNGNNSAKGTGTGSGPGPSAKDGATYTPYSDPKQNPKKDTIKKDNKNKN